MTVSWAPTLADVGNCIPTRTVNVTLPGDETYLNTFTADTRPTAAQAQAIIDETVSDVILAVITISTAVQPAATNAAKWRAAADIELAYPERNADANYYAQLDARARYEWSLFLKAADTQNVGTDATLPMWNFPAAPTKLDRTDL